MAQHAWFYHRRSLAGGLGYRICLRLFRAAVRSVNGRVTVARALRRQGQTLTIAGQEYDLTTIRRLYVIGFGKAAAPMASGAEAVLRDVITDGLVVTKYGHIVAAARVPVVEAAHPVPDAAGVRATERILALCDAAGPDDLVLCLVSGGGSALLERPADGVSLADKQETTDLLLRAGAPITALNTVRKHLSAVSGGQLARRIAPAASITLILSDVIGDAPDAIASGPTVPDPTTYADALAVVDTYALRSLVPRSVRRHLEAGAAGHIAETPKPGDPAFARTRTQVIADGARALDAAARAAEAMGLPIFVVAQSIEGEAATAGRSFAAIATAIRTRGRPVPPPVCVLAAGETTVQVTGDGIGGRNLEFSLAAALAVDGTDEIAIASLATDGGDGPTDAAGAVATTRTLGHSRARGLDARDSLRRNDSYTFFARAGGLVRFGPTGTNVSDLMIAVIG